MKIAIGSDHAGFELKQYLFIELNNLGYEMINCGTESEASVDYPDIAQSVANAVNTAGFDQGILICSTGVGMSIAANKIKGIRAALCHDTFAAKRARQHNDANILCLRGENIDTDSALEIVRVFLYTDFEGGRHILRLNKVKALEID